MTNYTDMSIADMSKLPGIVDLKTATKVKFIKALKAEALGNHVEAEQFLNEAILVEENPTGGFRI